MNDEKLIEFRILKKNESPNPITLRIMGNIHLENYPGNNCYVKINNITILDVTNSNAINDYVVKGETWAGHRYNKYDVLKSVVLSILRDEFNENDIIFICDDLKNFIKAHQEVACTFNGRKILKYLVNDIEDMATNYELKFATDAFAYYDDGCESMLMIRVEDGSIVTDMEVFAMQAIHDSIENIKTGKETLVYGDFSMYKDFV